MSDDAERIRELYARMTAAPPKSRQRRHLRRAYLRAIERASRAYATSRTYAT